MEPLRYIDLVSSVTSSLPPLPVAELGPPPLKPLSKHLADSRIIIVTSAGVRKKSDAPFAPVNDLTFRLLDAAIPSSDLAPSHPTPVRRPAEQDVNVVYPIDRLRELAGAHVIGGVTDHHLSFLGTIKRLTDLVTELAPAIVRAARQGKADAALLVPL